MGPRCSRERRQFSGLLKTGVTFQLRRASAKMADRRTCYCQRQRTWTKKWRAHLAGITSDIWRGSADSCPGHSSEKLLPLRRLSDYNQHLGDWQSLYQGINVVYVQKDDAVTAAQQIGYLAQWKPGIAIKIAQSYVDPLSVLPKRPFLRNDGAASGLSSLCDSSADNQP